ncbi:Hypoxia-inducible factor 1-alpha [Orchesella cincta]|uniref:Hypoxia-inducible factor 1-alpha n=1 Tax=Orchesella cincta TaxID=48709 RepID=A0A1D2NK68_ORCCI|nr:Hypoxia-inducible factor 1-alpha [Orchesella cincta]
METDFFAFCLPPVAPGGRSTRNTDKRRERSKVAARCRRGKESEIFSELSVSLPVTETTRASLDKASVMRLTLCDLKLKQMMDARKNSKLFRMREKVDSDLFESLTNNAISGFVLVCSCDGDVIFASEGISTCLGLSQYEVMGQSLLEFSHPCDHGDVKDMLLCNSSKAVVESRTALFRLKSANSTRGRNVHHRTTNYKVVSCVGRIFSEEVNYGAPEMKTWFMGICEPLLHPSDVDIPLNKQTFLSRHSPDMKFEYVDESVAEFVGYTTNNMVGKSLFDFYHACDGEGIAKSFKHLYTKGQTVTERSRFLAKDGGWIWIVTQATAINNNAGKPTSVVCIHFVTSGLECPNEILSHVQLRGADEPPLPIIVPIKAAPIIPTLPLVEKKPLHESTNVQKPVLIPVTPKPLEVIPEPLLVNPFTGPILSKPTPSTQKIFAPRTEDMDTGFLMPVNDMLIVTKDEPEDLTHLAPIAGDECVPLSNVPLLDDLLQWLDAADMEYTVLEGYEDPLPLPLIAAVTDSPIPMTVCPSNSNFVVKDDVVLESMPSPTQCDSPFLMSSADSTLMSSSDPLLLSPYKTTSPEPSPSSCMDLMNLEMFSRLNDNSGGGHAGGGTTISTDKCKDGGPYDEPFSGFPVVTDFGEHLFSPSGSLEESGSPPSPEHSLRMGSGGLGLKLDARVGPSLGILSQDPAANVGKLKFMATAATNHDPNKPKPEPAPTERPLPCKVAKPSFSGTDNKAWGHPAVVPPLQPPWKYEVGLPQSSPPPTTTTPLPLVDLHQQVRGIFPPPSTPLSVTTSTQTEQQRKQQILQNRLFLSNINPLVIQALLKNACTIKTADGRSISVNRKRNFLGNLLTNDDISSEHGRALLFEGPGSRLGMGSLVELTNQDCEVNAPLEKPLLDGPELLTALDTAGPTTEGL